MANGVSELSPDQLEELERVLVNTSGNVSLAQRFRALFTLKAVGKSDLRVIDIIGKGQWLSSISLPGETLIYV
jgi:deoxyhypusine monooxygenase